MLTSTQLSLSSRNGYPNKFFYCMHLRCWDILLQQHTLIAPPTKTLDLNELGRIFIQIPLGQRGDCFKPDWQSDSPVSRTTSAKVRLYVNSSSVTLGPLTASTNYSPIRRSSPPPTRHLESNSPTTETTSSHASPRNYSQILLCSYPPHQCETCSWLQRKWHLYT